MVQWRIHGSAGVVRLCGAERTHALAWFTVIQRVGDLVDVGDFDEVFVIAVGREQARLYLGDCEAESGYPVRLLLADLAEALGTDPPK